MTFETVSKLLEEESIKRNSTLELTEKRPDPLMIASGYGDEFSALIFSGSISHMYERLFNISF